MVTYENFQEFNKTCTERNVWSEYKDIFQEFWNSKIMNSNIKSIDDADIDPIIRNRPANYTLPISNKSCISRVIPLYQEIKHAKIHPCRASVFHC